MKNHLQTLNYLLNNTIRILDSESDSIDNIIRNLLNLPEVINATIIRAILLILNILVFVGLLLIVWGILEWLSGWNEHSGKRNIIRGIILLILASTLGISI